jgi:hypothetical protein
MPALKDERDRILTLVEAGQVTATEASLLLDTLEVETERSIERVRDRTVRIRATSLSSRHQKVNMTAMVPVSLIKVSLRLGARLVPQLSNSAIEDLLRAIESGATGRLLDLHDLEKGERLEIFVE